jgi:hypothetical protein
MHPALRQAQPGEMQNDDFPAMSASEDMTGFEAPPHEKRIRFAPQRRLSDMFAELSAAATGPVSVAAIREALGDRSFAALLVFFAAINLLPLPPGTTLILGLPLILVSAQMAIGKTTAWLPRFILEKSVSAHQFRRMTGRLVPRLQRVERLITPRYWPFYGADADRVIGLISLVMGISVTLPIPLGNWLPALSIALLGLSLSERDGILLGLGVGAAVLAMVVVAVVLGSAGAFAIFIFK